MLSENLGEALLHKVLSENQKLSDSVKLMAEVQKPKRNSETAIEKIKLKKNENLSSSSSPSVDKDIDSSTSDPEVILSSSSS